jgi:hypothetical protein
MNVNGSLPIGAEILCQHGRLPRFSAWLTGGGSLLLYVRPTHLRSDNGLHMVAEQAKLEDPMIPSCRAIPKL